MVGSAPSSVCGPHAVAWLKRNQFWFQVDLLGGNGVRTDVPIWGLWSVRRLKLVCAVNCGQQPPPFPSTMIPRIHRSQCVYLVQ